MMLKKSLTLLLAAILPTCAYARPDNSEPRTFSAGITAGAASPLKGSFVKNFRATTGLRAAASVTPWLGAGVEAFWGINTSRWPGMTHSATAFDNSYIGVYSAFNIIPLLSATHLPFGAGIETGAGWGHDYNTSTTARDHNFFATRTGIFFHYHITPSLTFTLSPSLIWNISDARSATSSAAYSVNKCAFLLQAGIRVNFGPQPACTHICESRARNGLNTDINTLRARLDSIESVLETRPAVIREIAVDNRRNTVYDIFFHSGSADVSPDQMPNVERIAAMLKQNPASGVVIEGYSSREGNPDTNLDLSRRRAAAVADLLIKRFNIAPARVKWRGCGIGKLFTEDSWNRVCVCSVTSPQ